MNLVFMGTPHFAVESLKALMASAHTVQAVVTVPDKPKGRGLKRHPSPVKTFALEHGLPVLQPETLKDAGFIQALRRYEAHLFVVVAFKILPQEVFTIPPKGTVNLHASLLPKYRGAAPINWAIINGETLTGITTMLIDRQVDTGGILLQRSQTIGENMTAGELHDILALKGGALLVETLNALESGAVKPRPQEHQQASKAPKITKAMCKIDFNRPVRQVHNLIRGLSPYPGAYCFHQNNMLKIFISRVLEQETRHTRPGRILEAAKDRFVVACKQGTLQILEVQLQGKKRLRVQDFFNGYALSASDVLN